MGNAISVKDVFRAAKSVVEEIDGKFWFGNMFSSITGPSACPQEIEGYDNWNKLKNGIRCHINSQTQDLWLLIIFMGLMVGVLSYIIYRLTIKPWILSNSNINRNSASCSINMNNIGNAGYQHGLSSYCQR